MANPVPTSSIVAVIGSGAMGAGIAQVAAAAGHAVKLFDARPEAAANAIAAIRATFGKLVEKGKMDAAAADNASSRLGAITSLEDARDAALIVEAITENLEAKRNLFASLEAVAGDDCILATNTSSISVTAIGAGLRRPHRLVGMHFFNPVPLMALVEVVSGLATDRGVADTVYATARAWGKSPVHTSSTPGFIVNRVARPYYAEALRVATEQGGNPATLDAVMREAGGFRMGPFELMDLIGHDVNFAVTSSVFAGFFNDPRFTPSLMQQELVNAGFLGRKSGRGFYDYGKDAAPVKPDTEHPRQRAGRVIASGGGKLLDGVLQRLNEAGVEVSRGENGDSPLCLECDDVTVLLTDGRTATEHAAEAGRKNTVLLDLALDFQSAKRVALAPADQCSESAYSSAVAIFQAAGFAVSRVGDVPGMIVMRTVAMLANEAADAVNQGVCNAESVDVAMQKGVNYPQGPLAWADAIGLRHVQAVLQNLAISYGEDRYRVSPLIQRRVAAGRPFHV